jgi:hypothetical protein
MIGLHKYGFEEFRTNNIAEGCPTLSVRSLEQLNYVRWCLHLWSLSMSVALVEPRIFTECRHICHMIYLAVIVFVISQCCRTRCSPRIGFCQPLPCPLLLEQFQLVYLYSHPQHHVPEGLGMLSCFLFLKMKLVPPSLPRSSYVSSSFWFILQCLFW